MASWTDSRGHFWMFGGRGRSASTTGALNDLWRYNPNTNNWTWMAGNDFAEAPAVYGIQGAFGFNNTPSARDGAAAWIANSGNSLYLFGGSLNNSDVWEYGIIENRWRIIKYTMTDSLGYCNGQAYHDRLYEFSSGIWPICRNGATAASSGSIAYVFGGYRFTIRFNDFFKFADRNYTGFPQEKNQWRDIHFASSNSYGIYSGTNLEPGGRQKASSFVAGGSFFLFGGEGFATSGTTGFLNYLWRFDGIDPTTEKPIWRWMKGESTTNSAGVYNVPEIVNPTSSPSARAGSMIQSLPNGQQVLFGGQSNTAVLNDVWIYDPSSNNWILIKGSNVTKATRFGIKGVQSNDNYISPRHSAAEWVDNNGCVCIFGGAVPGGYTNSMWKLSPNLHNITSIAPGNWNDPGIWSNNTVPNSQSNVVIIFPATVNDNAICNSLTVPDGAQITIQSNITLTVLRQ